jgi:hypothetical protein
MKESENDYEDFDDTKKIKKPHYRSFPVGSIKAKIFAHRAGRSKSPLKITLATKPFNYKDDDHG